MAKASIWLKAFNRDGKFTANKVMTVAGVSFSPGVPFDPKLVNTRRLRQLYEQRKIIMAPGEVAPDAPPPIVIPADWRDLPWGAKDGPSLRSLALSLNHGKLKNKEEAIAIVEAELAKRTDANPLAGTGQPVQSGAGDPPAEPLPDVEIPADWRDLPWSPKVKGGPSLRALAASVSTGPIANKDDAVAKVEAELTRREAALGDATRDDKNDDAGDGDKPAPIVIPENWESLDMAERIALANALKMVDEVVTDAEEADALIELEIERRADVNDGQPS